MVEGIGRRWLQESETQVRIPGPPGINWVAVGELLTFIKTASLFIKQRVCLSYKVVVKLKDNILTH